MKFHQISQSKKSVAMYEAQLTQKSNSNQAAFYWSTWLTWTHYKICVGKSFALMRNPQSHGFLLKLLC